MSFIRGNKFYFSACPEYEEEWKTRKADEKKRVKESRKRQWIELCLDNCGIPKRFIDCSFEKFKADKESAKALKIAERYTESFSERRDVGASLIFCGKPGTGKTHLACAIVLSLIKSGISSAVYTTIFKAIQAVKDTYRSHERSENDVIKEFVSPGLLVVDEVGVQYGSDAEKMIFYQILNGRYEDVKPTILISNLTAAELTEFIGDRCMDRMKEGGGIVVPFTWKSYRK